MKWNLGSPLSAFAGPKVDRQMHGSVNQAWPHSGISGVNEAGGMAESAR